jgi:hypothetical protein
MIFLINILPASPKSSPKERTLTSLFFRTLPFGEGRVRQQRFLNLINPFN